MRRQSVTFLLTDTLMRAALHTGDAYAQAELPGELGIDWQRLGTEQVCVKMHDDSPHSHCNSDSPQANRFKA